MRTLEKWLRNTSKTKLILSLAYNIFILWLTVFSRSSGEMRIVKPLFWEIEVGYWRDITLNILLFLPLGFLVGTWKGIIGCFILSFVIELMQYIFVLGYCEADDIMNNTIGFALGVSVIRVFEHFREKKLISQERTI